ncbi:Putative poly(Aspartic acid) Hydrolase (fragment) [Rhizobium mesoamericanum STM3625]|uniref:Putative poly(Aspartic acid) Hydrolase n=2 Tax=Rhizobium TaxID=379 RepID=K0Q4R5_9HYPH
MFGNSAGSQFVLRYLALTNASAVDRAVASNSGIYMLPDLAVEYPGGMGGLDLNRSSLQRYFGKKLTILLGEADSDSTASDLPRDEKALAQGPHRVARGLWHFDLCKQIADRLGDPLAWTLRIVPGAGHVDQRIFDTALDVLAG